MDREMVLLILSLATVGPVIWMASLLCPQVRSSGTASRNERTAWLSLWAPVIPAAAMIAALLGWAMFEPRDAEVVPWTLYPLAITAAYVWARAIGRACRALVVDERAPAYTRGLWRPRTVFCQDLVRRLTPAELEAAQAHEQAHVRHRDPLRLWMAQWWTDLQWPTRKAHDRFHAWRHALEMARDDEAREDGVDGADLAAAIIAAARFGVPASAHPQLESGLNDAVLFRTRIERLLVPLHVVPNGSSTPVWLPIGMATVVIMLVTGEALGERIVGLVCRTLP